MIPLFPELRPYLLKQFEDAQPGAEYVIAGRRSSAINLRTQFERIISRAGLPPWPKLFQNLRSTRQTELAEKFPIHVVCQWIGNSKAVAQEHYLQLTDAHFEQAAQDDPGKAAQKAAQQAHAQTRTGDGAETADSEKTRVLQGDALLCESVRDSGLGAAGFEPTTSTL